jgi:N6-adenosine-specific RNA methylase IME4
MKFDIAIADPNWHYNLRLNEQFGGTRTRFGDGASGKYDLAGLDEICSMPIPDVMADDALMFLWVTGPHLAPGNHEKVLRAWEFEPITVAFVWVKIAKSFVRKCAGDPWWLAGRLKTNGRNVYDVLIDGTRKLPGHYTASNTEYVILGKRGKPPMPEVKMFPQLIFAPLFRQHSRKPDRVHEFCDLAWPDARKVEFYARRPYPGWTCLGYDVDRRDMRESIPELAKEKALAVGD